MLQFRIHNQLPIRQNAQIRQEHIGQSYTQLPIRQKSKQQCQTYLSGRVQLPNRQNAEKYSHDTFQHQQLRSDPLKIPINLPDLQPIKIKAINFHLYKRGITLIALIVTGSVVTWALCQNSFHPLDRNY